MNREGVSEIEVSPPRAWADVAAIWGPLTIGTLVIALLASTSRAGAGLDLYVVLACVLATTVGLIAVAGELWWIAVVGLFARVATMFWDVYARSIFELPNAAADAESYYRQAVDVATAQPGQIVDASLYGRMLGEIYVWVGPSRMIGQYINVLLGVSTIVLIIWTARLLAVDNVVTKRVGLVAALFPNAILLSSVLLREALITFLVALAVYHAVRWVKRGSRLSAGVSMGAVLLAAGLHSAMIGLVPGLALLVMLRVGHQGGKRRAGIDVTNAVVVGAILTIAFALFGDYLFIKFGNVEALDDVISQANRRAGDSAYLTDVEINSFGDLLRNAPLKSFYFLTAPLPFDWRGIIDVLTFFTDSVLFVSTLALLPRLKQRALPNRGVAVCLFVALVGAVILFGTGVGNAGTAVRHRQKLTPVVLALLALLWRSEPQHQPGSANMTIRGGAVSASQADASRADAPTSPAPLVGEGGGT